MSFLLSKDQEAWLYLSPVAIVNLLLLAAVHHLFLHALLTFHIAAPLHLAMAGKGDHAGLGVVAPATAHAVAVGLTGTRPSSSAH